MRNERGKCWAKRKKLWREISWGAQNQETIQIKHHRLLVSSTQVWSDLYRPRKHCPQLESSKASLCISYTDQGFHCPTRTLIKDSIRKWLTSIKTKLSERESNCPLTHDKRKRNKKLNLFTCDLPKYDKSTTIKDKVKGCEVFISYEAHLFAKRRKVISSTYVNSQEVFKATQ